MGWSSPRTWVTGEVVTAAIMNTHVRDNLDYLHGGTGDTSLVGTLTLVNDTTGALRFKDSGGTARNVLYCGTSSEMYLTSSQQALYINNATAQEVQLWGGSAGTGRTLWVTGTSADAGNTTRDAPTLRLASYYWNGAANTRWDFDIFHDMTATTPTSHVDFKLGTAGSPTDLLTLTNNNGAILVTVYSPIRFTAVNPTSAAGDFWYDSGDTKFHYDDGTERVVGREGLQSGAVWILTVGDFGASALAGSWSYRADTSQMIGIESYNTSAADADKLRFSVFLDAGTYGFTVYGIKDSNRGILKIDIAGTNKLTFDQYNATKLQNQGATGTSFTVSAAALTNVDVYVSGKNASSSGYEVGYSAIVIYKTAT